MAASCTYRDRLKLVECGQRSCRSKSLLKIGVLIALAGALRPALLNASGNGTVQVRPLAAEDVLSAITLANGPLALSKNGTWVVYVVRDPKRAGSSASSGSEITGNGVPASALGTDIWLTDVRSGTSQNLTNGKGNNWAPSWSPDDQRVAFYSDRSGNPALWVYDIEAKRALEVSSAIVWASSNDVPKWTNTGRQILTKILPVGQSVQQAYARLRSGSAEVRRETKYPESVVTVYTADEGQQNMRQLSASALTQNVFTRSSRADLALVDSQTGAIDRVAEGFNPAWYELSPDNKVLALAHAKGQVRGDNYKNLFDLVLVGIGTDKRTRTVVSDVQSTLDTVLASFSPDGKWISYISLPADGPGDCILINVLNATARQAAKLPHPDLTNQYRPPWWGPDSSTLYFVVNGHEVWSASIKSEIAQKLATLGSCTITGIVPLLTNQTPRLWSPDSGQSVVVQALDTSGRGEFLRLVLSTGLVSPLEAGDRAFGGNWTLVAGSLDGKEVVFAEEDAMHAVDLWKSDSEFRHPARLSVLNPQLENYVFGRSRILEWLSADGEPLRGALLLPAGYQQNRQYPLLVFVYPGNRGSETAYRFGLFGFAPYYNMQFFSTRGYAVLYPDCPVNPGTIMQDVAKAVLPAINKTIETGIADPNRIGVMGVSLGGYGALSLIVQSSRFKAAVMHSGLGDLTSGYGEMSEDGSSYLMGVLEENRRTKLGTPWTARERYIENSPVFYLDRVNTPLLIINGSNDFAVEPFLGQEIFVDLRRLGKDVTYVKYQGEGHGIEHYPNQLDFVGRLIAWFDSHLANN